MSEHVDHIRRHKHRSHSRDKHGHSSSTLSDVLLRVVDGGLIGVIFVAPLIMGGRHPLGRLIFVAFVLAVALAWFGRQCLRARASWTYSFAELLLLAGLVLIGTQLVPLPESVAAWLSPQTSEILPAWNSGAESPVDLGSWTQISMAPGLTRGGLAMYLAYGLLFLVSVQRLESLREVERLLRYLAGGAIVMALLGIVQYFAGNGKFLWVYEHPFRDTSYFVKGSFINQNHFAHLLALGTGPLAWWILTALRRQRRRRATAFGTGRSRSNAEQIEVAALTVALVVVLFAVLLSLSRGGVIAIAVAATVSGTIFWRASLLKAKYLVGLTAMSLLLGGMLFIDGYGRVAGRLNDLTAGSLEQLDHGDGRRMIWRANLAAFQDHWLLGTGVGSHREVYPTYLPQSLSFEYTHAESGPLQVATETGVTGLLLVTGGIALCVYWCGFTLKRSNSTRILACVGAVAAGLAASIVHSVVDFVWYIPACMSFTVLLAACALRLHRFTVSDESVDGSTQNVSIPRSASVVLLGIVIVAGTWMIHNRVGPALASSSWDHYLQDSTASSEIDRDEIDRFETTLELGNSAEHIAFTESMIGHLATVLTLDSDNARAHVRMAAVCLRRFDQLQLESENAMTLSQIRDAAIASHFASRVELDAWLDRAVGHNRKLLDRALWHTRRGLQLCPLQGDGYIFLAGLCFLERDGSLTKPAYIRQALKVRPFDEEILFEAGKEAMLTGNIEQAIAYWKKSFHVGTVYRHHLVRLLAGRVPIAFLLENIQPELSDWKMFYGYYAKINRPSELRQLNHYYLALAQREVRHLEGDSAAKLWMMMHQIYKELGDSENALASCEKAHALAVNDFSIRYALGVSLLKAGEFTDAEKHFRWCLRRKPESVSLQGLMKQAVKERIKNAERLLPPRAPLGKLRR